MPRTKAAPPPVTPDAPDVRLVPIDSVHLDPHNVRTHPEKNLTAIRDSLRAFGQQKPLVVTQDGLILAGNGTWSAAKALGWPQIAVQVSTLSPEQARAYAVADNRTGELALWNEAGLADMLKDLYEQVLPLPGWEERDLQRLWGPIEVVDVEPMGDRAEALRQQYGVELGQRWQCGRHLVLCGDCTETALAERLMAGQRAGAVVTDPPYAFGLSSSFAELTKSGGWPDMMNNAAWFADRLRQWQQIAPDGLWWMFSNWRTLPIVMKAACDAKEGIESVAVWHKDWIGPGGSKGLRPAYELIVLFANGRAAIADRGQPDVMTFPWSSHKPHGHRAEKPLPLLAHLVGLTRGMVYDPFLGAGTTLIACEELQRTCYGIEIDPGYVAVTLHRWSVLTGETPVLVEG